MKLLIFIFLFSNIVLANDNFVVSPFVALGENQQLSLNFQTIKDVGLKIKIELKKSGSNLSELKVINGLYSRLNLQKINLGTFQCGTILNLKLETKDNSINENREFKSTPCDGDGDFYFGFMSDTQIKDEAGQKRANKLATTIEDLKTIYPFSLIVSGGDVVQHGGREEDWLNFFKTTSVFSHNTISLTAAGNHEYYESEATNKAPVEFLKYLRDGNSSESGNAVLDLNRIVILVLNSNFEHFSDEAIDNQIKWIKDKLDYYQSKNTPVIVSMHHSPYSSSAEWIRQIPTKLREALVPLLESHSVVKMMISGHLHMYERSIKNNLNYLVAGPSGGIVNYITYKNPYQVVIKPFVTTFTVFKVSKKQIEVTTFTGNKEMIDSFKVNL